MVWVWVVFGLVFMFLLFLVIYLLDHWQALDSKQRASFICNILTISFVAITSWTVMEAKMSLQFIQQEQLNAEENRIANSIEKSYEKETSSKVLIRTNQPSENEIKISGLEEGTKIFFEFDRPIKKSH